MSDLNKEMNVNFDDKTRTFSVNYGEKETVKEILKFIKILTIILLMPLFPIRRI